MCGIVGFVGRRRACPVLLNGLEKLSYRGYDSAGVAVITKGQIAVHKTQGKVKQLQQLLAADPPGGMVGIGHTRWATHGKPCDVNAHPHMDEDGQIAVVHNGMIDNCRELRSELENNGVSFVSETDTEVVAHLLKQFYDGDMIQSIVRVARILKGSYALGVLCASEPEKLFFVRCGSPLIAAWENGEGMIASDVPALLSFSRDVVCLEDHQMGVLTAEGMKILDQNGREVPFQTSHMELEQEETERGGFDHYMLKEIYEQPAALRSAVVGRNALTSGRWFPLSTEEIRKLEKVTIIACGTAFHAGLMGSYAIERLALLSAKAEIASEYRYRDPVVAKNELVIAISQSGETADTLAAAKEARCKGARVLAVCNVKGSTLAREAGEENTLYTYAGPEMAVASTKGYMTQTTVLILIAAVMADARKTASAGQLHSLSQSLADLPAKAEEALELASEVRLCAAEMKNQNYVLFVGRNTDYALAMEAALKLKEISYIFSQAYPAGEMKHGPMALLKKGQLVVAIVTQEEVAEKMNANLQEIHARGAVILAVCTRKMANRVAPNADRMIVVPDTDACFAPMLAVIPMQFFAYYMAVGRGCDVDQPRNLAKSVTVE